jgi:hypothetical protein
MKKTKMMLREEKRLGKPLEVIITEAFEKYETLNETALALALSPNTLWIWMIRLGLQVRRKIVVTQR